jgi:hypothetical protein
MPAIELASGIWEDAEAMVGKELSIMAGAIRKKLEVPSFDSSLHSDEETARRHSGANIHACDMVAAGLLEGG